MPPPCPKEKPPKEYSVHFWVDASYLMWWIKDARLPPLLTTSSIGTPQIVNGITVNGTLAAPGTSIIFGNSNLDYGLHSGGQFSIGFARGWEADQHGDQRLPAARQGGSSAAA